MLLAKDLLIKQQAEMLAQKEPLSREGKTSVLHLMTREDADIEKRSAEEQADYWKGQVDERDRQLEEKKRKIADLKQIREPPMPLLHFRGLHVRVYRERSAVRGQD